MSAQLYTQEQLDIELLKQQSNMTAQTLSRIENELISIDSKIETKIEKIDSKIDSQNSKFDSHFRWTVLLIFGLYGTVVTTLITVVGKAYNWFS